MNSISNEAPDQADNPTGLGFDGAADTGQQSAEGNPFNNAQARAKAEEARARREREEIEKREFDTALLHGRSEPWAATMAAKIDRNNKRRDLKKDLPKLTFTGAEALEFGAAEGQLRTLPELTDDEYQALKLRAAAELEHSRNQVRALARKIEVTERAAVVAPPEPINLADLLAEPDESAAYRIEGLWPMGGRVLLAAQYKAGKSTLVGNVIRGLVDGGEFLGRFATTPVSKVTLIDTELDTRTLRRWLRDQGIRNADAVTVLSLRGKVSTFDILDRSTRTEWADRCAGAEVVILDCVRPALDALGLSEDKDAGRFLVAFDELLAEIGAGEAMAVTHMGHQNERARGDSRLLDWNDAMWNIVRDPTARDTDEDAKRYFSALGRDVSLGEGLLAYDARRRWLSYAGGNRKDAAARKLVPPVLELIKDRPGLSGAEIERQIMTNVADATQKGVRDALKLVRHEKRVRTEEGPRRSQLHYIKDGDPLAEED